MMTVEMNTRKMMNEQERNYMDTERQMARYERECSEVRVFKMSELTSQSSPIGYVTPQGVVGVGSLQRLS